MKREIPTDWSVPVRHDYDGDSSVRNEPAITRRPMTPLEALMSAAPGDEPETSQIELLAIRDVLADAIDALPLRHKWVFEQHVIGKVPIRQLGDWMGLGKSYVWLLKEEALRMLRESLKDHPAIVNYLTRYDDPDLEDTQ